MIDFNVASTSVTITPGVDGAFTVRLDGLDIRDLVSIEQWRDSKLEPRTLRLHAEGAAKKYSGKPVVLLRVKISAEAITLEVAELGTLAAARKLVLSEAHKYILRMLSGGWSLTPEWGGFTINGKKVAVKSTVKMLESRGLIQPDGFGCHVISAWGKKTAIVLGLYEPPSVERPDDE